MDTPTRSPSEIGRGFGDRLLTLLAVLVTVVAVIGVVFAATTSIVNRFRVLDDEMLALVIDVSCGMVLALAGISTGLVLWLSSRHNRYLKEQNRELQGTLIGVVQHLQDRSERRQAAIEGEYTERKQGRLSPPFVQGFAPRADADVRLLMRDGSIKEIDSRLIGAFVEECWPQPRRDIWHHDNNDYAAVCEALSGMSGAPLFQAGNGYAWASGITQDDLREWFSREIAAKVG